jgi:outer membrane lipopolysaccharide assembly protein LptE/RlpB
MDPQHPITFTAPPPARLATDQERAQVVADMFATMVEQAHYVERLMTSNYAEKAADQRARLVRMQARYLKATR